MRYWLLGAVIGTLSGLYIVDQFIQSLRSFIN